MKNTTSNHLKYKKLSQKLYRLKDAVSGYDKEIYVKSYKMPNGMVENFFIDKAKDSVQIFALTKNKTVLCVRQFRAGNEEVALELPGGGLEKDENPVLAAQRELLEETGFAGSEPELLTMLPYSPYSTGKRYSYAIYDCVKKEELNLDPNEFLEVIEIPIDDFRDLMKEGKVRGYDIAYIALDKKGAL